MSARRLALTSALAMVLCAVVGGWFVPRGTSPTVAMGMPPNGMTAPESDGPNAGLLLGERPGLVGTVTQGGTDPRFSMPVDLVIETPAQMAEHDKQYRAHPEWFENVAVGVAYVANDTSTRMRQAQEDHLRAPPAPDVAATCASDIGTPTSGFPGRWLRCHGSGDSAAYFVADSGAETNSDLTQALTEGLERLTDPISSSLGNLGYLSPQAEGTDLRAALITTGPLVTVDVTDPASELTELGRSGAVEYIDALLATVFQHYPNATAEVWMEGSCDVFVQRTQLRDCSFSRQDLQPREPQ